MNITVQQGGIQTIVADAIIVNLFQGVTDPTGATGAVNQALGGAIGELIAGGDLHGKLGETVVLYPRGAIPARRVIVVGLGQPDKFDLEAVREAAAVAIKQAQKVGAANVATVVHGGGAGGLDVAEAAQAVVEGSMLALYRYDAPRAKKEDEEERQVDSLTLVEFDAAKIGAIEAGARAGQIIAESVYLARTLVNQPSNVATPTAIAQAAQAMCAETGLLCQVLEEAEMQAEGMGALLAVTQGATQPAKFVIMEHCPAGMVDQPPVVLVGKGVAFDTGGYSIKSAEGMVSMKCDMAGAASVIGAMRAAALLQLPLRVIGLTPLVENIISASAYKPADVFTAKNGVTIEIISTDAEGRMILADALCYANDLKPAAVIDVATLTGAKMIALGDRTNAIFCDDDKLRETLLAAGQKVGEPLWRMPLDPVYDRQIKSTVADIKNSGGRPGGAITAARFLAHFVGDWPWAHIDMAGSEEYNSGPEYTPRSYLTKGASGVPLRTFVEYLRRVAAG
ncbi:MAG: leucyl aminopeptidase [Chloroflexi bacterium]|nr:leucyl aminopeptidase [Chloroflexota bacterium]